MKRGRKPIQDEFTNLELPRYTKNKLRRVRDNICCGRACKNPIYKNDRCKQHYEEYAIKMRMYRRNQVKTVEFWKKQLLIASKKIAELNKKQEQAEENAEWQQDMEGKYE